MPERVCSIQGFFDVHSAIRNRRRRIHHGISIAARLSAVRGIEVAGLVSRRPPTELAEFVRHKGLGEGRIFGSIREMAAHVDVIALFAPNFARVGHVEEVVDAVKAGNRLKGNHL